MEEKINEIIKNAACNEEVWVTVEELYGDAGINYLVKIGFPYED